MSRSPTTIPVAELPGGAARCFEGARHGTGISFYVIDAPPAYRAGLHVHPYDEVFVVNQGTGTFTAGDVTIAARAGEVLVVPAGTPHAFVNETDEPLRMLGIHVTAEMQTDWLE
jgi:mannose-6-phosphate isomerase-like protein (cupin superfamily)